MAIQCLDSVLPKQSLKSIQQYVFDSENIAINGSPDNYLIPICSEWPFKPNDRYDGPWSLSSGRPKPASVLSGPALLDDADSSLLGSHPILVLGNRHDSYCSITGAREVAHQLGSSARLLEINIFGHTSFAQSSTCADDVVGEYFITGRLPKKGKVCPPDGNAYYG